jgi:hypothetical protein
MLTMAQSCKTKSKRKDREREEETKNDIGKLETSETVMKEGRKEGKKTRGK